ncbi:MAG TPA: hypothetical protein VKQ27_13585 [Acetobacteraceae bacterium]|nr:hypothetical protein [Acetobacteraceae bacterium]
MALLAGIRIGSLGPSDWRTSEFVTKTVRYRAYLPAARHWIIGWGRPIADRHSERIFILDTLIHAITPICMIVAFCVGATYG